MLLGQLKQTANKAGPSKHEERRRKSSAPFPGSTYCLALPCPPLIAGVQGEQAQPLPAKSAASHTTGPQVRASGCYHRVNNNTQVRYISYGRKRCQYDYVTLTITALNFRNERLRHMHATLYLGLLAEF